MRFAGLLGLALLVTACASSPPVGEVPPPLRYREEGLASWYGEPYHGRPTASGVTYDMQAMTAAHRTLPFGTWVEVTNLENQRKVQVLINDRGPFVAGRILDLSRAAAAQLGMLERGVARVRLEVLRQGDGMVGYPCWEVQVGAFGQEANVARAVARLQQKGFAVRTVPAGGGLTRVRVTKVEGLPRAQRLAKQLAVEFPGAMAVPCPPGRVSP
ncbi:MAG: septal ring lytic transglycosylase RlpA family protein [Thermoanaerobaculum sp.]|nr:septal ring lytic transglycosylase RlpA family protein [Thermoanaerobaculum sp.]MDW7967207.1 septal ring lytic transglycosylase RlpA family protein [Thermoanaerobaculum sp.]